MFDTIVIGGGPGGVKAAKVLANGGKKVALVADDLGGECLNYGCIPTKTYLWTAELFEKISQAAIFGIDVAEARINWQTMQKRRTDVVSKLKKGLAFSLQRAGVEIIEGRAKLLDRNTVEITPAATSNRQLSAASIILATGSKANFPPGFSPSGRILNNREILDLPEIPKSLLIIGGGAVGAEFASIFATLGAKVTIAEAADRLLSHEDSEISAELERVFSRKGIAVLKNKRATPEETEDFDKILAAVGRKPAAADLGLEAAGIQYGDSGVATNEYYETNVQNIFAIGDLAGRALLAYTAEREGEIAALKILGKNPPPLRYETVPNTIFCIPEVASAGLTEDEAKKRGISYVAGKSLASANSKALILGSRDGFAKIIAEKSSQKILGVHIIGEKASELIAEASLALSANMTLETFLQNIHGHPILGEILKEAAENALAAFTKA